MFKVGQKVVFKSGALDFHKEVHKPQENEIVTIDRFHNHSGLWVLSEYKYDTGACLQGFSHRCLFPIDFNFGEVVAEHIEEQINQEQLVTSGY